MANCAEGHVDWRDLGLQDYEYLCEGLMARNEGGDDQAGLSDSKAARLRRFSKAHSIH